MKGMIFSEMMFHAVIEGRKTQTRRICKIQPPDNDDWILARMMCTTDREQRKHEGKFHYVVKDGDYSFKKYDDRYFLPRYNVGETVYIKEPFCKPYGMLTSYKYAGDYLHKSEKWENPRTMAANQARYFIEITGVRCEMVKNISDEDCLKEGIFERASYFWSGKQTEKLHKTPQEAYAALFDAINGKGAFESNPHVFVYSYKLIK